MKNTSRKMYNIGNIVNIISLILFPILFAIGLLVGIIGTVGDDAGTAVSGWRLMGYAIYLTVIAILCFIFVGKAKRELEDENNKSFAPYIVSIVFGLLSWFNPFYVVAGVLGIIVESRQGNNQPKEEPKQVEEKPAEQPAEEPKAE